MSDINNVKTIYIFFFFLLKSVLKAECNYQENIFSGPFWKIWIPSASFLHEILNISVATWASDENIKGSGKGSLGYWFPIKFFPLMVSHYAKIT
jgi:hypothetical protein